MLVRTGCSRKSKMPEPVEVIIVVEGTSDVRVVKGFAERALLEKSNNFDPDSLKWRGLREGTSSILWQDVRHEIRERTRVRLHANFRKKLSDDPSKVYEYPATKALLLCHEHGKPQAVVMMCDADSQPERIKGLNQAREKHIKLYGSDYPIIVGMPDPCREAWVVCGFTPKNSKEQKRFNDIQKRLDFDPTREPHRLNTANAERNAKRVLGELIDKDVDREEPCWTQADFQHLLLHGDQCKLKAYLEEVQEHLSPLLGI
jgi:hypothetical protein